MSLAMDLTSNCQVFIEKFLQLFVKASSFLIVLFLSENDLPFHNKSRCDFDDETVGQYNLPFTFLLPMDIPSSFEGKMKKLTIVIG